MGKKAAKKNGQQKLEVAIIDTAGTATATVIKETNKSSSSTMVTKQGSTTASTNEQAMARATSASRTPDMQEVVVPEGKTSGVPPKITVQPSKAATTHTEQTPTGAPVSKGPGSTAASTKQGPSDLSTSATSGTKKRPRATIDETATTGMKKYVIWRG